MRQVITEFGKSFTLSAVAFQTLKEAKHAGDAEAAFNDYAPHVPRKDRASVWFAV